MCVALGGTVHCKASRLVFTCLLRQLIVCVHMGLNPEATVQSCVHSQTLQLELTNNHTNALTFEC